MNKHPNIERLEDGSFSVCVILTEGITEFHRMLRLWYAEQGKSFVGFYAWEFQDEERNTLWFYKFDTWEDAFMFKLKFG